MNNFIVRNIIVKIIFQFCSSWIASRPINKAQTIQTIHFKLTKLLSTLIKRLDKIITL